MPIFQQVYEIETKHKTQTRRVVKPGETFVTALSVGIVGPDRGRVVTTVPSPIVGPTRNIHAIYSGGKLKWQVGREYAIVPKRGHNGVGFIRCTALRVEYLKDLSHKDAIAEGIKAVPMSQTLSRTYECRLIPDVRCGDPRDVYRALWEQINGPKSWSEFVLVHVMSFEYVGKTRDGTLPSGL